VSNKTNNLESLAQIAKKTGLSTATISRVLNNSPRVRPETRHRVLKLINESRSSLRKPGATTPVTIGVSMFDFHPDLMANLYTRDCLAGVAESAHQYGFNIHMIDLLSEKRNNETYPQALVRLGLSAVIHVAFFQSLYEPIIEIAETGFPQFVICGRIDHPRVNWIDAENFEASRKAVRYLINLGHRRIAVMTGNLTSPDQVDRCKGYRAALEEAGVAVDPELIVERATDIDPQAGASATMELLAKREPPTAIFYTNGELAFGGIKACNKMGRAIPDDVSIVSFDDSRLPEYVTPALTYVLQPVYDLAKRAGQCLAAQLRHKSDKVVQEVVVPDFFINESTGPARASS
jgi:DNA-binding LacI/PurR family transcriptional regulator